MKIKVELEGRDILEVECQGDNLQAPGAVTKVSMVGCSEFLEKMQQMRKDFGADLAKWPVPEGQDHSSVLLREMVLRLRGQWKFPYEDAETCHCRSVATHLVDQAIIAGAHTTDMVTRVTSASTACGTCRPDVQKMIDYRLQRKPA